MNIKLSLLIVLTSASGIISASQTPVRKYIAGQTTEAAQQYADARQQLEEARVKVQKASARQITFQQIEQCVDKATSVTKSNNNETFSAEQLKTIACDCALDSLIAHRNSSTTDTEKNLFQVREQTIKNIIQEMYHMNLELTDDKEEHSHLEQIATKYTTD